jgi:tRNA(Ile)-lysidine synthase
MDWLGPWLPDTPDAPPVALAVSGGGDSIALAWLAASWRKRLIAFVVDHGLRPEFADEAASALKTLSELGIPAELLRVRTLPHGPALARRARDARYEVLIEACRRVGAVDLLVAHQADDQVETVAMRKKRGSGVGLSGMAWVSERADIRIVRPLLDYSREALRNTLRQAGLVWCDDPSNENERAERVRVRKQLGSTEKQRLLRQAEIAADERVAQEQAVVDELVKTQCLMSWGWAALGEALPSVDVLAALIRCIGGGDYLPSRAAVEKLREKKIPGTLGGVRLLRGKAGDDRREQWLLIRETAAMEPLVPAGRNLSWDRRFVLRYSGENMPSGLMMGAAGFGLSRKERAGLPAALTATLPALWKEGQLLCVPHLGLGDQKLLAEMSFDFAPASPVTATFLWMNAYLT